ncbi:MAG: hypothetical protein HY908_04245 [Myxococcales bacterium]|nr:hypothetical protein [Myxococcales bacterium]
MSHLRSLDWRRGAIALAAAGLATSCTWEPRRGEPAEEKELVVTIEPRIPLLATYPCSSCHATRTPQPERHPLKEFHAVRTFDFSHGDDTFWCYQCHSIRNLDQLVTATGALVSFDEAQKLCTSCHGDKLDDWKRGMHGLIVGEWNGPRTKLSCPACHNPHHPRYPTIEPEKMPETIKPMTPFGAK